MMSSTSALRAEFLDTLYEKTREPGFWKIRSEGSFAGSIGNLTIHLDFAPIGSKVGYSLWIFNPDGLVDRIYDSDLSIEPATKGFKTYADLMKAMHVQATDEVRVTRMSNALAMLKAAEVTKRR